MPIEPCGAKTGKLNCGCCSHLMAECELSKGHEGKHAGELQDAFGILSWEDSDLV